MTHHTFDFRATFRNGSRVAYAVKPAARLKKDNVLDVVNRIRAVHVPEFANEVLVVTEAQATPVLGLNAIDIVHARKTRIQTDCEEVLQLAHGLGPIEVWRLCQCAFDPGCVKNALLCLIYDGRLRLLNPRERFGDASVVQTNAVM